MKMWNRFFIFFYIDIHSLEFVGLDLGLVALFRDFTVGEHPRMWRPVIDGR